MTQCFFVTDKQTANPYYFLNYKIIAQCRSRSHLSQTWLGLNPLCSPITLLQETSSKTALNVDIY